MYDIIIICLIALAISAALFRMRRDRKNGKSCGGCSCTGKCGNCKTSVEKK